MKFIHTADWHLGNSMHDIDRKEEAKRFLDWLRERIVDFGAECLVVAGDIFDTANPPVEARRMYFRFLASLLDTCCKNIVLVGGNHDSGALLDAPRDLLDALNIQMVGSMGDRSVEDLVKELTDASGNVVGISAAVPFVRENDLRRYLTDGAENFADCTYKGLYGAVYGVAEKLRAGREIPIVATGHLYAAKLEGRPENDDGRDMKNHGVRDIVGNLGTVPVGVFPEGLDYVALGHIHYTTMVAKNPKVRYSGSPFVLGFDEAKMPHYILTVDLAKGQNPVVEKVEVPHYFEFLRVSGTVESIKEQLNELRNHPTERPLKIEIEYEHTPGIQVHEVLAPAMEGAPFEVVNWRSNRTTEMSASDLIEDSLDSVKVLSEEEVFKILLQSKLGVSEVTDEVKKYYDEYLPLFKQVVEEVESESQEEK